MLRQSGFDHHKSSAFHVIVLKRKAIWGTRIWCGIRVPREVEEKKKLSVLRRSELTYRRVMIGEEDIQNAKSVFGVNDCHDHIHRKWIPSWVDPKSSMALCIRHWEDPGNPGRACQLPEWGAGCHWLQVYPREHSTGALLPGTLGGLGVLWGGRRLAITCCPHGKNVIFHYRLGELGSGQF